MRSNNPFKLGRPAFDIYMSSLRQTYMSNIHINMFQYPHGPEPRIPNKRGNFQNEQGRYNPG